MNLLSRTLIANPDIRSLIRHLSVSSLDPFFGPPTLYDWLPLLPHNTIISLYVCTGADEPFLSQLLRSPMLHSIQHLGLAPSEPCFIGRNLMSGLLAFALNVSQISINLPRSSTAPMFSDLYAHFTPLSCRIRHITVSMGAFTPLFTDLLRAAQTSLESQQWPRDNASNYWLRRHASVFFTSLFSSLPPVCIPTHALIRELI